MTTTCPYCRVSFAPEEETVICEACATPHHADCYAENGGCTVFGCSKAPVDEPKISISTSELSAPARAAEPAVLPTPTPPPPRTPGIGVPPPPMPVPIGVDRTRGITPPLHLSIGGYVLPPATTAPAYLPNRDRTTYILFGIFLGAFGAHNFYAGYTRRGVSQLLLTLLSCFFGSFISWIWALVEICVVNKDADGVAFI